MLFQIFLLHRFPHHLIRSLLNIPLQHTQYLSFSLNFLMLIPPKLYFDLPVFISLAQNVSSFFGVLLVVPRLCLIPIQESVSLNGFTRTQDRISQYAATKGFRKRHWQFLVRLCSNLPLNHLLFLNECRLIPRIHKNGLYLSIDHPFFVSVIYEARFVL